MTRVLKIMAVSAVMLGMAGLTPAASAKPAAAANDAPNSKRLWTECSSDVPVRAIPACTEIVERAQETPDRLARAYVNRGRAHHVSSALEKALDDINKAIAAKPDFAEAYYERGITQYNLNKVAEALSDLDRAIELNPNYALAYDDRGWLRQDTDPFKADADFDKAMQIANAEIKAGRNLAENYYIRADVYAAKKQYPQAIADANQSVKLRKNYLESIRNRAAIHLRAKDYVRAIADTNEVLRVIPDNHYALATRGFAYFSQGKSNEALADFERIIALNPHSFVAYSGRAAILQNQGKRDLALADFNRALRLRADDKYSLVGRAQALAEKKEFAAALADFNHALLIDPQFLDAYLSRAEAYIAQDQHDLALADCDRALQIDAKSAVAYFYRGKAFIGKGDRTKAIAELTRAIEIEPKYPSAYMVRGTQYVAAREFERAIDDVTELLKIWPTYAEGFYWRGALLLLSLDRPGDRADKIRRAIVDLAETIRLEPNHIRAYVKLAEAHLTKGDNAPALQALNDMVRANMENAEAFIARAQVYEARGDREQAIADFSAALQLKPDDIGLLKNRARLREAQFDHQGALADLNAIIGKSTGQAKYAAYVERVEFQKRIGNTRAAIADLGQLIDDKASGWSDDDRVAALVFRGRLRFEAKEPDNALADYSAALRLAPGSIDALQRRAWLLSQTGKFEAALEDLNAFLRIKPDDAFALGERGWLYTRLGDYDRAVADLGRSWQASRDADTRAEYNRAVAAKQLKFAALEGGFGAQVSPVIGSADVIAKIAVSPDGSRVAIGGALRITLWDAASGRLLHAIEADTSPIRAMMFSPDGRQLHTATARGIITSLDVMTAKPVRSIQAGNWLAAMALSPDGTQFVTGGAGGIEVWSAEGQRVAFASGARGVSAVAFSPDGARILAGQDDTKLTLWEKSSGQLLRSFEGHSGKVTAVAFTRDGQQILSGADDATMRVWDAATGAVLKNLTTASVMPKNFRSAPSRITELALSGDGARVLVQKENSSEIWDAVAWRKLIRIDEQRAATFPPDGASLLTAGSMRAAFHDINTGRMIRTLGGRFHGVHSLMLSRDGARLFVASDAVRLWDIRSGGLVPLALPPVSPVLYSPDNDALSEPLEKVGTLLLRIYQLAKHDEGLPRVAITRDGTRGLTHDGTGKLKLWDVMTGNAGNVIDTNASRVTATAFSPQGDLMAAAMLGRNQGNTEARIGVWKVTGDLVRTLPRIDSQVTALAVSEDGLHLSSGNYDGTVSLWELRPGGRTLTLASPVQAYHQHPAGFDPEAPAITSVAFSPDGRWVVAAGGSNGVRLWHTRSGDLIKTFGGHVGHVTTVVFSADGGRVICGGTDGRVSVWDTESGLLLATLYAGDNGEWLAVTPAGFFAASEKGVEMFGISDGKTLLPLSTMRDKLQRPELVAELLKGDPDGKYRDAVQRLNVEAAQIATGAKAGR